MEGHTEIQWKKRKVQGEEKERDNVQDAGLVITQAWDPHLQHVLRENVKAVMLLACTAKTLIPGPLSAGKHKIFRIHEARDEIIFFLLIDPEKNLGLPTKVTEIMGSVFFPSLPSSRFCLKECSTSSMLKQLMNWSFDAQMLCSKMNCSPNHTARVNLMPG